MPLRHEVQVAVGHLGGIVEAIVAVFIPAIEDVACLGGILGHLDLGAIGNTGLGVAAGLAAGEGSDDRAAVGIEGDAVDVDIPNQGVGGILSGELGGQRIKVRALCIGPGVAGVALSLGGLGERERIADMAGDRVGRNEVAVVETLDQAAVAVEGNGDLIGRPGGNKLEVAVGHGLDSVEAVDILIPAVEGVAGQLGQRRVTDGIAISNTGHGVLTDHIERCGILNLGTAAGEGDVPLVDIPQDGVSGILSRQLLGEYGEMVAVFVSPGVEAVALSGGCEVMVENRIHIDSADNVEAVNKVCGVLQVSDLTAIAVEGVDVVDAVPLGVEGQVAGRHGVGPIVTVFRLNPLVLVAFVAHSGSGGDRFTEGDSGGVVPLIRNTSVGIGEERCALSAVPGHIVDVRSPGSVEIDLSVGHGRGNRGAVSSYPTHEVIAGVSRHMTHNGVGNVADVSTKLNIVNRLHISVITEDAAVGIVVHSVLIERPISVDVNEGVVILEIDREGGMHVEGHGFKVVVGTNFDTLGFLDLGKDILNVIHVNRNTGLELILQCSNDSFDMTIHQLTDVRIDSHVGKRISIRNIGVIDVEAERIPAVEGVAFELAGSGLVDGFAEVNLGKVILAAVVVVGNNVDRTD